MQTASVSPAVILRRLMTVYLPAKDLPPKPAARELPSVLIISPVKSVIAAVPAGMPTRVPMVAVMAVA